MWRCVEDDGWREMWWRRRDARRSDARRTTTRGGNWMVKVSVMCVWWMCCMDCGGWCMWRGVWGMCG